MNAAARTLVKDCDLLSISQFVQEDHEHLDQLPVDGRANLLHRRLNEAGGLCVHACQGVRHLDPFQAKLGLFSLAGELDLGEAYDAIEHLGLLPGGLMAVSGKHTNRSRASMTPDGQKQIVRLKHDIDFSRHLDQGGLRKLQSQLARSKAGLLGRMSPELTASLIEWGQQVGTYMALCPGREQYAAVSRLQPEALFVNVAEAREITGETTRDEERVFRALVNMVCARHVILMTTGPGPVYVVERNQPRNWKLEPRKSRVGDGVFPFPLGNGDVLAGVASYLLGQPRRLIHGGLVREVVALAQATATYHYTRDPKLRNEIVNWYRELLPQVRSGQEVNAELKKAA